MPLPPPTHEKVVKITALRGAEGKFLTTTNPNLGYKETPTYKNLWIKNLKIQDPV